MTTIALSAAQVFQIADPIITLNVLVDESTPLAKVDLKARLAIELNRKLLASNGEDREIVRKKLKLLMMDQMNREQERDLLQSLIDAENIAKPLMRNSVVGYQEDILKKEALILKDEADIERVEDSIIKLQNKYDNQIARYRNAIQHHNTPPKKPYLTSHKKNVEMYRQYIRDKKVSILKHETDIENDEQHISDAEAPSRIEPRVAPNARKLSDIDQSIIEATAEAKELEDAAKITLQRESDINPAAYEKTRSERIAEANTLFQKVINNNEDPHITFPFERIGDFTEINQLFAEQSTGRISNMVLIIYRSSELFGHWVSLTRSNDLRRITYFNSYGSYIDKALDYIPEQFRDDSKQNFPYLLKLLSESNYEIHWNSNQLQVMDKNTQTCGRWSAMWMRANKMGKTLEEFVTPFLSVPLNERDEIIVKLTDPYLI